MTHKTLLDLWPALYAILEAESREQENFAYREFSLSSVFAAAAVPVHDLADDDGVVTLVSVGYWLKSAPTDISNSVVANLLDETLRHGKKGRRFAFNANGRLDFLERLETLCRRCGWAIVDGQAVPLTLQLPSEVTALSSDDRSEIAKAIKRYQSGDFSGAITSILGMLDLLCHSILEKQYDIKAIRNMAYQSKVGNAYIARRAEFEAALVREGVIPHDANEICDRQQNSVSNAGGVLMRFRTYFADAHGTQNTSSAFVQQALDSAVYIVRVLGALPRA